MAQVIIDDILPWTQLIATAGQTVFNTTWTADVAASVVVYARAEGVPADDLTDLVDPSEYNVTFIGDENIVRVTFLAGRTLDDVITITRDTAAERANLYTNTNFTPSMLNSDFGRLTLVDQQNQLFWAQITPRYNISETLDPVIDTIFPLLGALESWRKNDTNTAFEPFIALGQGEIADVDFIVKTANSLVPSAQSLGSLTSGILKNNSVAGTGTLTISPSLSSLDDLGISADKLAYGSGVNTYSQTNLTPFSRTLLDDADAAEWRATLDVGASGDFFAIANNLSEGVPATMRTNLGLVIGTTVQAYDATLQSISALGTTSDRTIYTTGLDTWAETVLTSFGRSLIDDANAADAAATLAVLPLAGGTMTGALILAGAPTLSSEAVTKGYVDDRLENFEEACLCLADDLTGYTYDNGVDGVGATLTAPGNGVFETDDVTPALTNRVLVNLSVNEEYNGPYTVTTSDAGSPAVLTRATDYDQASFMQAGDTFAVVQGTTYGASQWVMSQVNPITIGTTDITFSQLAGQGALLKANNLSDLANVSTARTNLGLAIGTNVQAYDDTLQSISGLGTAANKMIYTTGVDTWAETDVSTFGREVISIAGAASSVLVTDNTGVPALVGAMTNGQLIIGSTGATPVRATLSAGNGITITNSAGGISIASSSGGIPVESLLLMGG